MATKKINEQILNFNTVFLEEDGGYSVVVPTLPGCVSQGDTFEEAVENIKEPIELYLEDENVGEKYEPKREFIVPVEVNVNN